MNNDMAVNPDKFQAKILSCDKKENKCTFKYKQWTYYI